MLVDIVITVSNSTISRYFNFFYETEWDKVIGITLSQLQKTIGKFWGKNTYGKQGYALKNWEEGLSNKEFYPWESTNFFFT